MTSKLKTQSVEELMALIVSSVAVNERVTLVSSLLPVHGVQKPITRTTTSSVNGRTELGRRRWVLLSIAFSSSLILEAKAENSKDSLIQKYLKKSEENKAKNDKERLDDYYKRNYKDYFEFLEGSFKDKDQLSESEKKILDWLKSNR